MKSAEELLDEASALRLLIEGRGFKVIEDGPYLLTTGQWSPVALVPVDPRKILKALDNSLGPPRTTNHQCTIVEGRYPTCSCGSHTWPCTVESAEKDEDERRKLVDSIVDALFERRKGRQP